MAARKPYEGVRLRGTDDDGFHLAPRSDCCNDVVVYYRSDVGRYVGVRDDEHFAELTATERGTMRCGLCNGNLA